jgi:hypothetical protein
VVERSSGSGSGCNAADFRGSRGHLLGARRHWLPNAAKDDLALGGNFMVNFTQHGRKQIDADKCSLLA